jgi:H+/Cl- antiporter ClcA
MTEIQVTALMIVFVAVFVAIDVVLAVDKSKGNTYSEIITKTGERHPWFRILFLVAVGVLLGHWFW